MDFINRKQELGQLNEYYKLSQKHLIVVAISGLRRTGKTTLVKEFIKNKDSLYFFIYESKTSLELLREFGEELRRNEIITDLEKIDSWQIFFEILFQRCHNYIIVFDEFQNFYSIDNSIFSIMQRFCDEYKTAKLNIIILGSLIGLFKKIFEDKKQPLYGRISAKINLKPFDLKYSIEALKYLGYNNLENMLKIYGLFGGFPKYYAVLEDFNLINKNYLEIIEYLFVRENAPLETEVQDILKQEFGKRSSLYYSILHSIAIGKTKLNEIANYIKMKESSITRHLSELEYKFGLIKSLRPQDSKKNTRYYVNHPLIYFWFKFIYDKFSSYSLKNNAQLMNSIKSDYNTFFGKRFEDISLEFIKDKNERKEFPFQIESISNWWGFHRVDNVRHEIEIDFVATNKHLNKILFIECKWQDNIDAKKVISELKEKTKFVNWRNNNREEYFCIIGKSFKSKIKYENILVFDIADIEHQLKDTAAFS